MRRTSPPKHRHDGTSPLPLGIDWSTAPKRWDGKNTMWPHDPRTGWSYCVMIPSWIVQSESEASADSLLNPVIFYRVLVGIQSSEGISTGNVVLRRFSDFMKLFSAIKKAFPRKTVPSAPPKHALLRINSSRMLLEERRCALEKWIGNLLSDIEVSRSAPVAAFLELEDAVRSSFQGSDSQIVEMGFPSGVAAMASSMPSRTSSAVSLAGSSTVSSDGACEILDPGKPELQKIFISQTGVDDAGLENKLGGNYGALMNGVVEGVSGESSTDQGEVLIRRLNDQVRKEKAFVLRNSSVKPFLARNSMEFMPEHVHDGPITHARKLSEESVGSDVSSSRGSEFLTLGVGNNFITDIMVDISATTAEASSTVEEFDSLEMPFFNERKIIFPVDQRHKLYQIVYAMQRRLMTTKTDMEDIIARLNQEMAVKEYLMTKVKDLEGELEDTKKRSKENLQKAIVAERERFTQMQWDADELRRKCVEMETKLKLEKNEKTHTELEKATAISEKELLLDELNAKQRVLDDLRTHSRDMESKSKADVRVLVKEVKNLRSSQQELKGDLDKALKENAELEEAIKKESLCRKESRTTMRKLLHECELVHKQLQDCSVDVLTEEGNFTGGGASHFETLHLLATSDNHIGLLLAEAQLLASEEHAASDPDMQGSSEAPSPRFSNGDAGIAANGGSDNCDIRNMLTGLLIDNARLRKEVNLSIQRAVLKEAKPDVDECPSAPPRKSMLNMFNER